MGKNHTMFESLTAKKPPLLSETPSRSLVLPVSFCYTTVMSLLLFGLVGWGSVPSVSTFDQKCETLGTDPKAAPVLLVLLCDSAEKMNAASPEQP